MKDDESHWTSEVFAWDGIIINQVPNSWDYEIWYTWYTWYAEKSGFPRKHPDGLCTCVQLKTSQHWNLPSSLPPNPTVEPCCLHGSIMFHMFLISSFWCFPTTKNPQPYPPADQDWYSQDDTWKIMGSPADYKLEWQSQNCKLVNWKNLRSDWALKHSEQTQQTQQTFYENLTKWHPASQWPPDMLEICWGSGFFSMFFETKIEKSRLNLVWISFESPFSWSNWLKSSRCLVKNHPQNPWSTTPGGLGALHKFFRTSTRQSAPCSMPCPCHAYPNMPCLTKSTKNEHESDEWTTFLWTINEQRSYDQLGQQRDLQTTTLVLVSAADLVIPHGTPVTTASLPKGGVRRDLSILGDRPDVGKKYAKMCFKWVRKWIPWFSIRANTSWVRKFPSKGSKT